METNQNTNKKMKRALLIFNAVILTVGVNGGPLVMRLYFLHGGKRVWLSSFLETGAWPLNFIPLIITYLHRRSKSGPATPIFFMSPKIFLAAAVIGVLTGVDNYLYAYGVARLPVSTTALIIASQLGFTALFAYLLVGQKFNSYSINALFLLTVGAGVLALHTSGDRPEGESSKEYYLGFATTLGAAALYGFVLPLVELTYKKAKQGLTYTLVIEIQLVVCFFASLFCTIGMLINKDFQAIPEEAKAFGLGEKTYYVVQVFCAILWQFFFLGVIGVIFVGSSLLSGIFIAVLLPVTEILGVLIYKEKFKAEKAISLILALWGFGYYLLGELEQIKQQKKDGTRTPETETQQTVLFHDENAVLSA